jgi:hypothetical protein
MHVTTTTAETAVETCDPNILALAMALAGVPQGDRDQWLLNQTQERVAEALKRGADDQIAKSWSEAWHDFVCSLIALESD